MACSVRSTSHLQQRRALAVRKHSRLQVDEDIAKQCERLLEWAEKAIVCKSVQCMAFSETGRGLGAQDRIVSGAVCLQVSHQIIISSQKMQKTRFPGCLDLSAPSSEMHWSELPLKNETPEICLTFWLVNSVFPSKTSKFQPYLNTLPTSYDNLLCVCETLDSTGQLFNDLLIILLDSDQTELVLRLNDQRREFIKTTNEVLRLWPQIHGSETDMPSYELLLWAFFTAQTRCLYYAVDKARKGAALVPFFDLINHSGQKPNVSVDVSIDGNVFVRATRDIYAGEQIFFSYGDHSLEALFVDYGYVPANDEDDVAVYRISSTEKLVERVRRRQQQHALPLGSAAAARADDEILNFLHSSDFLRYITQTVGVECTLVVEHARIEGETQREPNHSIVATENDDDDDDENLHLPWQLMFITRSLLQHQQPPPPASVRHDETKAGKSPPSSFTVKQPAYNYPMMNSSNKTTTRQGARVKNAFCYGEIAATVFKELRDEESEFKRQAQLAVDKVFKGFVVLDAKNGAAVENVRTGLLTLFDRKIDCLSRIVAQLEKLSAAAAVSVAGGKAAAT